MFDHKLFFAAGSTTASVESVVGKSEGKLQGKEGLQVHLPTNEKLKAGPHCKLLVYQLFFSKMILTIFPKGSDQKSLITNFLNIYAH